MNYNREQELAIKTIDKNICVNASAGTGKTKVLTDRYIEILNNGKLPIGREVESILAITFTKKASAEMKTRISDELYKRRRESPRNMDYYNQMNAAHISTIHSFCTNILRENPIEAEIDPNFEVIDDFSGEKLLNSAIASVLKANLEDNEVLKDLMLEFKYSSVNELVGLFNSMYKKRRIDLQTDEEIIGLIDSKIIDVELSSEKVDDIVSLYEEIAVTQKRSKKIIELTKSEIWETFKLKKYSETDELEIINYILNNTGTCKAYQKDLDEVAEYLSGYLVKYEKLNMKYYEISLKLINEMDKAFSKEKDSLGVLDYEDLLIKCNELLNDSKIVEHYQNQFRYIMIDEYQDTNLIQRELFYKLCSVNKPLDRNNLFVVGDPKQSIYAFRGADVEAYNETLKDIEKADGLVINLKVNYRSSKRIIDAVNEVFSYLIKDYNGMEHHKEIENEMVEIIYPDGESDLSEFELEAELIVEKIKVAIESGYSYSDIAILFRRTSKLKYLEEKLKESSIPYINSSSGNFYTQNEIIDLNNLLKSISNLNDDLSLIGLMRSPLIGLSDDELLKIKLLNKSKVIDGMREYSQVSKKCNAGYGKLIALNNILPRLETWEIVDKAVEIFRVEEIYAMKKFSDQSIANINKYKDMAMEYSINNNGYIEDFIDYIEEVKESRETEADVEKSGLDAINLMTIHGSKGLQFKIVILYDTTNKARSDNSKIRFDSRFGMGINIKDNNLLYQELGDIILKKENEELNRLLYVAMTRAEEQLILSGIGHEKVNPKTLLGRLIDIGTNQYIEITNISSKESERVPEFQRLNTDSTDTNEVLTPILMDKDVDDSRKSLSNITAFQIFKKCKKQYYFKYILKIKESVLDEATKDSEVDIALEEEVNKDSSSNIDPLTKGTLIHKVIENIIEKGYSENILRDVLDSEMIDYDEGDISDLSTYVANFLKIFKKLDSETEVDFTVSLKNGYINGAVDLVQFDGDDLIIADFKTNKLGNKDELVKLYTPQLQLYSYAMEKIYDRMVKEASIYFLRDGSIVDVDISKVAIESTLGEINAYLKFISGSDSIERYFEGCGDCMYCNIDI
ncbi:MAG: UvrD-helicase domain-containing protein [Tissierellia bacterium]|nr:UvrD-helicase domain-containing protein [Tissierellia bacterium]